MKDKLYVAGTLFPLAVFAVFASLVPSVHRGATYRWSADWVPSLGVTLSFSLDGLSLLFCLIISGIGFLIALYASRYLGHSPHRSRFYLFFYLFMIAMLGLVLSDDLIVLFVFWELTTIVSYLLIGFEHEKQEARYNARQALLVTGGGGLALLIGILLIGRAGGTYSLTALTAAGVDWRGLPFYPLMLTAVFIGAFTKSAQFPFHFWLPNAMSAPTPISAFLHSATMVKAGIYLLIRFHPIFGGTKEWMDTLVLVGAVTAVLGSVLSLAQRDMKKILAYTTIMALGIITMFLGGATTPSLTAAITFLLVHALYKSALFLIVGIIDHETGTRDIDRLGGLLRPMPVTAFATAAAVFSMAGFPLFFGFIGKEIMYKGALTEEMFPSFATTAALLSNAMMAAVAAVLAIRPFLVRRLDAAPAKGEAPVLMWIGPALLGLLSLAFGVAPRWVGDFLVAPAVHSFHVTTERIQLKLWHGINLPLLLSALTLTLGAVVYLLHARIRAVLNALGRSVPWTWNRVYALGLSGIELAAKWQTRALQSGSLYMYLLTIFLTFLILTGAAAIRFGIGPLHSAPQGAQLAGWLVVIIIISGAAVVMIARSRLLAIGGLGIVGAGAALVFLTSGAPDVAMTQLLVETLTLVVVALVLLRLPRLEKPRIQTSKRRFFDLGVSVVVGGAVTVLILAVTAKDLDRTLTEFYEAQSYIAAHGRNVVNVILVDFRGIDTLGEITVVATAGLAAFALIRLKRRGS
ncbi:MAG: proton-conducting transporter membrane subunit [bacterium]